jgi:flagellin
MNLSSTGNSQLSFGFLKAQAALQRSSERLSSGSKVERMEDDPSGAGVSLNISSGLKRGEIIKDNIANALSFLQTQAGVIQHGAKLIERFFELATQAADPTKSSLDVANYQSEWTHLFNEYDINFGNSRDGVGDPSAGTGNGIEALDPSQRVTAPTFNGVPMLAFNTGYTIDSTPQQLKITMSADGSRSMDISQVDLDQLWGTPGGNYLSNKITDMTGANITKLSFMIDMFAFVSTRNGAEQESLHFALDSLELSQAALESVHSRLADTDVAAEVTRLSRANILAQSGAALTVQANTSTQVALRLLS